MNNRGVDFLLPSAYCSLLVYVFGVVSAALFAALIDPGTSFRAAPRIAFALAVFGFPVVAPVAVFAGIALTAGVSQHRHRWLIIIVIALCSGIVASWLFQHIRPFDLYHEGDGSRPGWQPVQMASSITLIALLASLAAIAGSALLSRRVAR
jgi:fatty acid desaturase